MAKLWRVSMLCLAVAGVAVWAADREPVVIRNAGFEDGLAHWQIKVDPLDPDATAADEEVSRSGQASLRFTQTNPQAYSNAYQLFEAERMTNYVVVAWIKAERVKRSGIGINFFVGDRGGHGVGDPIPTHLREGTYDWTRVVVPLNSGVHDAISLIPYLHQATGTVWFDDIAVYRVGSWDGPEGPPQGRPGPPKLPEEQEYDYDTVSAQVASPHWAFGRPGARALRVAVLAPVMAQRETAELMQRLDCEATAIMTVTADAMGRTGFSYGSLAADRAVEMARTKLEAQYDALIIGRQKWASLPEDIQGTIVAKVRGGMGLVYVRPVGEDVVATLGLTESMEPGAGALAGLPLASLPAFAGAGSDAAALAETVSAWRLGEGRVMVLDYGGNAPSQHHYLTPPTFRHRGGFRHYDYYQSLLAKAARWAAGPDGPAHLATISAPDEVARGEELTVRCELTRVPTEGATLTGRLRRMSTPYLDGEAASAAVPPGATTAQVEVAANVPVGEYWLDLTLGTAEHRWDWGSAAVAVSAQVNVAEVMVEGEMPLNPGEPVQGRVRFSAAPEDGQRLLLSVRDAYGRVIAKEELEAGQEVGFGLDCSLSRSVRNELRAELVDAAGTAAVAETAFTLRREHDMADFHFVVWGQGGSDYIAALLRDEMRRWGADACDMGTGGWDPTPLSEERRQAVERDLDEVARTGMAPLPYISRIWPARNQAGDTVRDPCLTDPTYREALEASLRERTEICRRYCPLGYTLGDENFLGNNNELCTSPTCLANLRGWLGRHYGSVDALNAAWGGQHASLDAVVPLLRDEADEPAKYPRWVSWRLCMNEVFADAHRLGAEAIGSVDPGARVGFDGAYGDRTSIGYDWWRLGRVMRLWNVYLNQPVQVEAMRSFRQEGTLTGCWFGGYTYQRLWPAFGRWAPWAQLFAGCNSSWFYSSYTSVGGSGELGFRPDLRAYDCWQGSAEQTARIKRGVGKLLLAAQRENNGVAMVYSPASQMVSDRDARYGGHLLALRSWVYLLEDAGYQYDLVAAEALGDGGLDGYSAVILPAAIALPEGARAAIEELLSGGGVALADWGAGLYDEMGVRREAGLLDECFGIARSGERTVMGSEEGVPGLTPMASIETGLATLPGARHQTADNAPVVIENDHAGGRCVYLNFGLDGYRHMRGPTGGPLQELVRQALAGRDAAPPVELVGEWGSAEKVEAVQWRLGEQRFIGLLKMHDTSADGEDLQLQMPGQAHVYDVLSGEYLGQPRSITTHMGPGEARLYALLPHRTERVEVTVVAAGRAPRVSIAVITDGGPPGPRVIHVELTDPKGQPYPAATANLLAENGEVEYLSPIGLEAAPGTWTLTATDVSTGIGGQAHIAVQ